MRGLGVRFLSLVLVILSAGCGGYFPLRWSSPDLWTPSTTSRPPMAPPSSMLEDAPEQVTQEGISAAIKIIPRAQAKNIFHADLMQHRVQPLIVMLQNSSEHTYAFHASQMSVQSIPAATVAKYAYVHPVITAVRLAKWVVMFVPGLLMESMIEPTTTFDFPNFENAAKRPVLPHHREIQAEFLRHEIPNGLVAPKSALTGFLFVRPFPLGRPIRLTLMNVDTQQPLVLEVPLPPPVYADQRDYAQSAAKVWDAVTEVAGGIPSWKVTTQDPERGVLVIQEGFKWWGWSTRTPITLSVQAMTTQQTRVRLESLLPRAESTSYGMHSQTIDQFFEQLDNRFPRPVVALPASGAPSSARPQPAAPSERQRQVQQPSSTY